MRKTLGLLIASLSVAAGLAITATSPSPISAIGTAIEYALM